MKVKLDENLPEILSEAFTAAGHDAATVRSEGLAGRDDTTVFEVASFEDRLLVTQDLDFSDVRRFKPGTHPGVLLIRLQQPSRQRLIDRMCQLLADENLDAWVGCFVVVSDRKLRVRRP